MCDLTNPIFHDEEKARVFFERERWADGVVCPFCNNGQSVASLNGKSMGPGWYYCNSCDQKKFTVRTGSVMERSHIPLTKWALGFRLMAASKKGVSAKQLQRMLSITYRSAWFMAHRIREAMAPDLDAGPIGGEGKVVESDETFVGGKKKNVHKGRPEPKKHPVHALVERGGKLRAKHVTDASRQSQAGEQEIGTAHRRRACLLLDRSRVRSPSRRQSLGWRICQQGWPRAHSISREFLCADQTRCLWLVPLGLARSTCRGTLTSLRSVGIHARLSALKTRNVLGSRSRAALARGFATGQLTHQLTQPSTLGRKAKR